MTTVTLANTIGDRFTNSYPWTRPPVVITQDGGRHRTGGVVGTGAAGTLGKMADDASSSGVKGTWDAIERSQGTNQNTWSSYSPTNNPPWYWYAEDFTTGALDPHPSGPSYNAGNTTWASGQFASNATFPGYWSYYDNGFAGADTGLDGTSLRDPGNWITQVTQPPSQRDPATGNYRITDTGSIKTSVANQYNFTPANVGVPISSFKKIQGYRSKLNPGGAALNYDSSWDIYGWAHTAPVQYAISLEVMFWTYWNGGQAPWNIAADSTPTESLLDFGDGNIWDLYMTPDTLATGGVTDAYSYGIFCLHDVTPYGPQPLTDSGWIDILTPLRYFVKHYVVTSGGAAAQPLDIPIWQIIEGWEMASTGHVPVQFTHLDTRLVMS